jgi:hypothetical protein
MGKDEIALLARQFVPVVFNSVNKSLPDDKHVWKEVFHSWTKGAALPLEGRLPGTNTLFVFTASGQPIKLEPALRAEPMNRRLQAALAAFANLPEAERAPAEAKAKVDLSKLRYASGGGRYNGEEPPPNRLVLRVFNRLLKRDEQGRYDVARVNWTQFQLMETDPSGCWCGYEGHPRFKTTGARVLEPTRDMFWLMEPEWQALVPANAKPGDKVPMPPSASRRLLIYGCHNWWAAETLIRLWNPEALQQADVTATVTAVTPTEMALHLDGPFHMAQVKPFKAEFKGRVGGVIRFDRLKKEFTRFDMVVLGDYQGIFAGHDATKSIGPVPTAFAFELARHDTAADDVIPIGLTPQKGGKLYLATGD